MRWADDVIRRTRESYQRGLNANKAERIRLETINTTLRAALESREASLSSLRVEDQPAYIRLREENARLKKLVVHLSLDQEMLKAVIAKNGWSS